MTAQGVCGCGYKGPGVACKICTTWNASRRCTADYCPRCNTRLSKPFDLKGFVVAAACGLVAALLMLVVCSLLTGCGPRFIAHADLLEADASTDAVEIPEAASGGAGGALSEPASAGEGGLSAGEAGAASSSGAPAGGMGSGGAGGAAACSRAGWNASAFASYAPPVGGLPSAALDGDLTTRWASGEQQAAGQWFQVDLPAGTVLEQLELDAAATDMPLELELELDGAAVASTESMPGDGVLRLVLAQPTPARSLRLLIVTPAAGQWWSIRELRAVCQ